MMEQKQRDCTITKEERHQLSVLNVAVMLEDAHTMPASSFLFASTHIREMRNVSRVRDFMTLLQTQLPSTDQNAGHSPTKIAVWMDTQKHVFSELPERDGQYAGAALNIAGALCMAGFTDLPTIVDGDSEEKEKPSLTCTSFCERDGSAKLVFDACKSAARMAKMRQFRVKFNDKKQSKSAAAALRLVLSSWCGCEFNANRSRHGLRGMLPSSFTYTITMSAELAKFAAMAKVRVSGDMDLHQLYVKPRGDDVTYGQKRALGPMDNHVLRSVKRRRRG
jgi:hypothetical protein